MCQDGYSRIWKQLYEKTPGEFDPSRKRLMELMTQCGVSRLSVTWSVFGDASPIRDLRQDRRLPGPPFLTRI